eukprot:824220-Rhodomonas_salina.6
MACQARTEIQVSTEHGLGSLQGHTERGGVIDPLNQPGGTSYLSTGRPTAHAQRAKPNAGNKNPRAMSTRSLVSCIIVCAAQRSGSRV